MSLELIFQRGGRHKTGFKYVTPTGENLYLTPTDAFEFLISQGFDETSAHEHLADARESAEVPTRNYNYDCKAPIGDDDVDMGGYIIAGRKTVIDYFFEQNRYANRVTEIERWLHDANQAALETNCPEYERLCMQAVVLDGLIQDKSDIIKGERARKRARVSIESVESEIKELKSRRREISSAQKAAKCAEYDKAESAVKAAQSKNRAEATARKRALRNEEGWNLLCQTKTAVEKAKGKKKRGNGPKKKRFVGKPRFTSATGEGSLVVQISGGTKVTSVVSASHTTGYIHIAPNSDGEVIRTYIGEKGFEKTSTVRERPRLYFRIGSRGRKPLWAVLPLHYHRPLPVNGIIKQASLKRERIGTQWAWTITFSVAISEGFPRPEVGSGRCAVDFGWRKVPGGIRVAYWKGDDGRHGELVLEDKLTPVALKQNKRRRYKAKPVTGFAHIADIQSIREDRFNKAIAVLRDVMPTLNAPDWFIKATATVGQWKSARRLSRLVLKWTWNRFDGDEKIMETLLKWRNEKEEHLFNWERQLSRKAAAQRLHLFRNFAAELRKRYGTIGIENLDRATLARRPAVEDEGEAQIQRWQFRVAATGLLEQVLKDSGMEFRMLDSEHSSATCHECSHINDFGSELLQKCENCGAEWDRDYNAASVLLDRLFEVLARERHGDLLPA